MDSDINDIPMGSRPFLETLRELRNGVTLEDLADHMAALVAAVRDTNKAGTLTLTIKMRPATKNDATTVLIDDVVTVRMPKAERSATIMFTTEANGLSRDNPRQRKLDLRSVADEKQDDLRKLPA